ncbi:unnamed protein product [Rhizophagus irregularis]|uniref:Uncharacterized protein n=1 Tax=Rhizophagus irregularis TaxID=588596 RepID=A0A916E697_9GLOM|nr:unnamed protein product [Rhizophagus irregularis]
MLKEMDSLIFSFLFGCSFIVYLHNFFISIFNCQHGISNFSLFKITINLSGAAGSILSVFLAYELSCERIVHIALFRLHVGNICKFEDRAKIVRWGYIGIDLIIDIFVTIRLIQVLKKRIQNAAESNQMTERSPKNNMFNAVNYWSYLQLGSTLTFNILAVVEIITWLKYGSVLTIRIFQTLNNIIFSYMITYDKEIVKTIAGKAARAKYFNSLVKNIHKNSVTIENIKLEDFDNNSNKRNMVSLSIDNEEFTVV